MSSPTYKYINKLRGKRVLIFGGTSGFGFAVAEAAIEHGASIIISSSNPDKLAHSVKRLKATYPNISDGQVKTAVCNLAELDTLDSRLEALLEEVTNGGADKIDHVTWTADDSYAVPTFQDTKPDDIFKSLRMRAYSSTILATVIAKTGDKFIPRSPDASVTFTNGSSSHKPVPGWAVPAMASASLEGLVRALACDLAPLRVNLVSAGPVLTELLSMLPDGIKEMYAKETLVKRLGRPEDVAEAYIYVMKDGFVTGSVLFSEGGRMLA
ncbi:putative short-chain dehydrogenase [Bisporella sp. PMI_857]|nr:putative short-chain dehydrogenase [Bisporella sp. PMI_857]